MQLTEKYRPKSLEEVVGQDRAVALIRRRLESGGFGGRAVWISGASGVGKTTLARIIAATLADPFFSREFDSGADLCAADLDSIEREMGLTAWGKGGRAFIVNEAHGLTSRSIQKLLGLLERIPSHVVFVFTTTKDGQEQLFGEDIDAGPLLSRCIPLPLTNQGLADAFAKRALEIARGENLDGQPLEKYVKLARDCKNNMRTMLQRIDAGAMAGGVA